MEKEYKLGSIVVMKKQHPCGENKWEITRIGADIKINIKSTMDSLPILDACRDYIDGFEVLNGTMDDAFIAITGKEIRE